MNLRELARKLKVSHSTVSRALNPATAHRISKPVRERIQARARQEGYSPNQLAQSLARGRSYTIGVILYSAFGSLFFDDYLARVQQGIYEVLGERADYACKLTIIPRGRALSHADQPVVGNGVDGILISTICDFTLERFQDLASTVERRWRLPTVALNLIPPARSRISTVGFSNKEAARKAVAYLLQRGHKHIGMIYTDDGSTDVVERVEGYKTALAERHIRFDPLVTARGNFTVATGFEASRELFKRSGSRKISALFCTNDEMAMGAIRALEALGKPCPDKVAVMGFDGLVVGEFFQPGLTTVSQPMQEIARAGTRLLLDLIEGRQKGPVRLSVPSQLIVRDSA